VGPESSQRRSAKLTGTCGNHRCAEREPVAERRTRPDPRPSTARFFVSWSKQSKRINGAPLRDQHRHREWMVIHRRPPRSAATGAGSARQRYALRHRPQWIPRPRGSADFSKGAGGNNPETQKFRPTKVFTVFWSRVVFSLAGWPVCRAAPDCQGTRVRLSLYRY